MTLDEVKSRELGKPSELEFALREREDWAHLILQGIAIGGGIAHGEDRVIEVSRENKTVVLLPRGETSDGSNRILISYLDSPFKTADRILGNKIQEIINLLDLANLAVPMVSAALGARLINGDLKWSSGESITEVARRLCQSTAFEKKLFTVKDVWKESGAFGIYGNATQVASAYLTARSDGDMLRKLDRFGVGANHFLTKSFSQMVWGGPLVSGGDFANALGVRYATFRSSKSRGKIPFPDLDFEGDPRWFASTVEAFVLLGEK